MKSTRQLIAGTLAAVATTVLVWGPTTHAHREASDVVKGPSADNTELAALAEFNKVAGGPVFSKLAG